MNVLDVLNDATFVLNEGLVVLKNSKRFSKLAAKMERSLQVVSDEQEKREILDYIQNVKQAASEFAEIESAYKTGNRDEAKAAYNKLRVKYFKLVKDINTETMKKFILAGGLFFIFSVLLNGVGAINAGASPSTQVDTRSIAERIAANNRELSELKSENQKLGALNKNLNLMKVLEKRLATLKSKTGVE